MKKIISIIIAAAMILSALPLGIVNTSAAQSIDADPSLVLNRPAANVLVTELTRVAYQTDSMKAPSGNNSVIVKSTPSGIPYLSSTRAFLGYAGETPVATTVVFTPGAVLDDTPVLTCTNSTVKWTGPVVSNETYTWTVTGGTAVAGSTLLFTVNYTYTDRNAVTGKSYTHTYSTSGTSYVEPIATPAGLYSEKRSYDDWGIGTTTENRSYLGSYILGKNTYGSIYDNGTPDGSIAFGTSAWITYGSFTDEYGVMQYMDGSDASRDFNVGYGVDSNRPIATVYYDKSVTSTLSDLNLRAVTTIMKQSDEEDEIVTVTMKNAYVLDGLVAPVDDTDEELTITSDEPQATQLNITRPTTSLYYLASNFTSYFTGTGPSESTDYTVVFHYQTAAGWNDVRVSHTYGVKIVTYDKGPLRTLVENVQSLDPSVKITGVPQGDFKGYNPQYWYYANGWQSFSSALNTARTCLEKPNVTQQEIDAQVTSLQNAYNSLQLKTADYSVTATIYNQALAKNPDNYTLASWARLQTLLDNYRSDYSVIYQPAVDKMGMDIKEAVDALEERYADYSQLLTHVAEVNRLARIAQSTYHKSPERVYSGWTNLVSVLTKSGVTYNELDGYIIENYLFISDQAKVDGYVMLVERALNSISFQTADFTEANKAEKAYKVINIMCVMDDIAAELTSAYNALVALHGLDITHQNEIDTATQNLNYWLDRVEYKPADTTAAEEKIAYAYSLDQSLYGDFSGVERAIESLEAKMTLDIRYQSEINRAVASLQSAIDRLTANTADYTLVDEAIEAVAQTEADILEAYEDTYGFTADVFYSNWSNVTSAINNVIRGLDFTHQVQVDAYAVTINNALNSLQENTADYTQVDAVKTQAYSLYSNGSSTYTAASLNNLLSVYMSVESNLPISSQARVDGYAAAVQQAINELEYLPASYTNVNTQINSANQKIAADAAYAEAHPGYTLYTSESLAALEIAMAEVVDNLDIRYQSAVNGYASAVSNAISALEYAPADYTAVNELLASLPDDMSVYTSASVSTLNAVVNSINYTYTADKQSTVDRYITSINLAVSKLKYKNADYSAVTAAINSVPSDSSVYTENSWQALQDQINAVEYGLDITRQSEVDTCAQNINTALGLLAYRGADYTQVENAKLTVPDDLSIYTDESVAALNTVLDSIDYYCTVLQQSTVDGYADAVTAAVNGLEEKPADYTSVQAAIAEANEKISSGMYTEQSVAILNAEIAEVVWNLKSSRQADVDLWANNIVKATKDLEIKLANYTELQNILNLLDNSSSEIYTILYTNFNEVMPLIEAYRAENVRMDVTIDRQAEVDAMVSALRGYIDSLIPAPSESFRFTDTAYCAESGGVKYAFGFKTSMTKAQLQNSFTECENVTLQLTYAQGSRNLGTGSKIEVVSDATGEVIDEYIIVIFGDVDGNAKIDTDDAALINAAANGQAEALTGAAKLAANVVGTRATINSQDADAIMNAANGAEEIDQATGKVAE